jgi:eukaryotic-like serine/threonine-protein kinase
LIVADAIIGQTLDGRYRIESVLGRGGMGVVYRATHIHIDAQFAVKILNQELVANHAAIERFRREAKAAGRITHPNAIKVTDFGVTQENIVYLVMELVDGKTLNELLYTEGPLDFRRAVSLMSQVCAAVEAAHESGVIHRDLKPDNIIVKRTGATEAVKVGDFGIAKLRERSSDVDADTDTLNEADQASIYRTITEAGTIIGTPQYMSPEQCRAKKLDQRSDVYSLGVIFYEMICGRGPFTGGAPVEVLMKQVGEIPRPPSELIERVPSGLETSVMRALEKDPANRPATAAEFSAELERAIELEADLLGRSRPTVVQRAPATAKTQVDLDQAPRMRSAQATNLIDAEPQSPRTVDVASSGKRKWAIGSIGLILLIALIAAGVYRFRTSTTAIADEMVLIPGGTFQMGLEDGEPDERPVHEERIKDFYLDKYEVTNEQYKRFVDQASYKPPSNWTQNSYPAGEAKLPVTYVSWFDAVQYAKWAGKRLPTEAEWEYAARNGSKQTLYPWGNQYRPNLAAVGVPAMTKPFPVGRFENDRNEFGVYDLAGNVCEWVEDSYHIYGSSVSYDVKVFRGGSFAEKDTPAEKLTGAYRWYVPPDPEDKYKPKIGFRCAKDAK